MYEAYDVSGVWSRFVVLRTMYRQKLITTPLPIAFLSDFDLKILKNLPSERQFCPGEVCRIERDSIEQGAQEELHSELHFFITRSTKFQDGVFQLRRMRGDAKEE